MPQEDNAPGKVLRGRSPLTVSQASVMEIRLKYDRSGSPEYELVINEVLLGAASVTTRLSEASGSTACRWDELTGKGLQSSVYCIKDWGLTELAPRLV